jgi:death on curing protein
MNYLTPEQVLFIHSRLISETGGAHGVRDIGLLESAVERPRTSFGGVLLYPEIFSQAAALMESLVNNHPFVDGNKRTGVTAAGLLLRINGMKLICTPKSLERVTMSVATGKLKLDELALWLKQNIKAI